MLRKAQEATKSVTAMVERVGKSPEVLQEFGLARDFIVAKVKDQGTRDIVVKQGDVKAIVSTKKRDIASVETEHTWVEMNYYRTQYEGGKGDPYTNGLGHIVAEDEGVMGVIIPAPPVKKLRMSKQAVVDVHRTDRSRSG